jgi:glycosyltransferase involved in cell wall biosynthesis
VIEDGKTGRLVSVNDPKALADAMLDVMNNRLVWQEMSRHCQLRASEFDTNLVLQKHLNHII